VYYFSGLVYECGEYNMAQKTYNGRHNGLHVKRECMERAA